MTDNGGSRVIVTTEMFSLRKDRFRLYLLVVALAAGSVFVGLRWQHAKKIRQSQLLCEQLQSQRNWTKLLIAAREWQRIEPGRREALRAGATAGKELYQAASTFEFLRDYPRESKDDIPWLTLLVDLQFGPLHKPEDGAETCREILRLDPDSASTRQRLLFFYAVTVQPVELLHVAYQAAESREDLPEFYVYAFLADGLKLSNALIRIQQWLNGNTRDELLMVAYALNTARNLDGGVPPVDEMQAAALRQAQQQRTQFLQKLRSMFPDNHQVLAYDLGQAVESGQAIAVANALSRATVVADEDYRFWRARGWLFLKVGDLKEAEQAFLEAIRLHPLDWRTRYYFADWARRSNDLILAEKLFRLAAEGKSLETDLLAATDMRTIDPALLERLAVFSEKCQANQVATRLRLHLADEPVTSHPGSTEIAVP